LDPGDVQGKGWEDAVHQLLGEQHHLSVATSKDYGVAPTLAENALFPCSIAALQGGEAEAKKLH